LLPLDDLLAQQAAELAADYRLRGADATFLAVAQQTGSALVTLDVELRTRAASRITTYTPDEALAELRRTST
jgi:predicted nucleic acid-binding protein